MNKWKPLFKSTTDEWGTPKDFYNDLNNEFNFNFDPCPLGGTENAIFKDWPGRVFCNPPYSKVRQFLEKGIIEIKRGNAELVVFLVFARTDTKWFHDLVYNKAEIRFIKGRLKFGKSNNSAPAPSMLVIYKKNRPAF